MTPFAFLFFCSTICLQGSVIGATKALGNNGHAQAEQILFKMPNFKMFSEGDGPKAVHSHREFIDGMPWQIQIENRKEQLAFWLCINGDSNDLAWICHAAAQFSVVSSKNDDKFVLGNLSEFKDFHGKAECIVKRDWKFEDLMDPKNGAYNQKDDSMTFKAEVKVHMHKWKSGVLAEHTLLVNDKSVLVNKYLLAAQSEFFQKLFFGKENNAPTISNDENTPKIKIENVDNAVEHFQQLVSIVNSPNAAVNEDSVENVLLLANHFKMKSVVVHRRRGKIVQKMANLKAFWATNPNFALTDEVSINGGLWKIQLLKRGKLAVSLCYSGQKSGEKYSKYYASFQLSVVPSSARNGILQIGNLNNFKEYIIKSCEGMYVVDDFEKLLDPRNGVYDAKEDAITFSAEIVVKKPKAYQAFTFDAFDTLLVNDQVVNVNKYLLAAHSERFRKLFFDENAANTPEITIDEIEDPVETFRRLISIVNSPNAKLDDGCVQVAPLADRFQLDSVVNRCADFLMNESKASDSFKFIFAHQYNIVGMKKAIIKDLSENEKAVAEILFLIGHCQIECEAMDELKKECEAVIESERRLQEESDED